VRKDHLLNFDALNRSEFFAEFEADRVVAVHFEISRPLGEQTFSTSCRPSRVLMLQPYSDRSLCTSGAFRSRSVTCTQE